MLNLVEMGTGGSVLARPENETEAEKTTFGDRVEITRNLPVENFGKDDAHNSSRSHNKDVSTSRGLSTESASQRKGATASIRSLLSSLTKSECSAGEAAELKLQHVVQLKKSTELDNERLRRELAMLRASVSKWKNNHNNARQDESQALLRAESFEKELERVKRQFKCYRDGKEKEIHNLMKTSHELMEKTLHHSSGGNTAGKHNIYPLPERLIGPFENDLNIENLSLFKEPGSLEWDQVPDCNTVFPLLAQVITSVKLPSKKQTFKFFLSVDKEATRDAKYFKKVFMPKLQHLCEQNGKYLVLVESCITDQQKTGEVDWESVQMARCDLFFGMLGNPGNTHFLEEWKKSFHVFSERNVPLIFCVKDTKNNLTGGSELTHFIDLVVRYDKAKVSFYSQVITLVEENDEEIQNMVKEHFEIADDDDVKSHLSISDEELISDCESSFHQFEVLRQTALSTSGDIGFTKYCDQLNEYVNGAGPSPPLVVNGASGCGKTSLLAKWTSMQLSAGKNVVLYHFARSSSSDRSTDPAHVVRRFASQLLGFFPCLYSMLHCDSMKCEEYFPRLLETVPSRVDKTIVIVIDAVDKLLNATSSVHLSWLNDPLPATVRVILSVNEENQPASWSSWPTVNLSPLTSEESIDVLVSRWCNPQIKLENDEAGKLLQNLSYTAMTSPLFLSMLSHELSRSSSLATSIKEYSSFESVVELTIFVLKQLEEHKGHLVNQVLSYVCCSRNGLAEAELMELLSLQWSEWVPLVNSLAFQRSILIERDGIFVVSHEQVLRAILTHLCDEDMSQRKSRNHLVNFYFDKLSKNCISPAIVDQLPWLLQQLDEKEKLQEFLSRTDVFQMFIQRSLYSELLGYWRYLDVECSTFASVYYEAIRKKEGDTACLEIALLYETLGRFLKSIDVLTLSMKCLERALEMKEMVVEPDDPWVGQSLHYLADLYLLLGNLESAESSYKQTLEINENALGKDHPLVAKELEYLAYVKKKQNKEKACTNLQRKAAQIRHKSVLSKSSMFSWSNHLDTSSIAVDTLGTGRTTPELASSLHSLGVLFMVQKRYQDAETLLKKGLTMRESLLGESDPALAHSLDSLASLFCNKKMYSEAIGYYEKSVDIKKKNLDPADPNLISTMNHLAMAFRKEGNYQRSETTYRQVLTALQCKHDDKDPAIATALHNLAVVNSEQKKLQEALELFKQALEIYEDALGSCHPKVSETLRNLAKVYLDMGNCEEASSHLRRSQMIQDNDFTVTTISSQASFLGVSCMDDSTLDLIG